MIYEFLQGRLGNQMFQYAHARALQHRKHDAICFNLKHAQKEGWRLCYLNINKEVQYTNSLSDLPPHSALHLFIFRAIQSCWGRVDWKYQPILALFFNIPFNFLGIYCCPFSYVVQYKSVLKDRYSRGYWQSEKYFQPISKEIKTELKVITPPSASNQKIIDAMQAKNAVCVHIRRGDYVGLVQLVCTPAYYYKAMDVIASKVENPQFYIFSDSIPWVKENMNFSHPVHFVEQDNEDYEELRLMYTCKHFIISNSSFSWWAQYLSENEQKVVVAPSRWFNNNWKTPDVYMDFWNIVEV